MYYEAQSNQQQGRLRLSSRIASAGYWVYLRGGAILSEVRVYGWLASFPWRKELWHRGLVLAACWPAFEMLVNDLPPFDANRSEPLSHR